MLADGLLGPAVPFRIAADLIHLERLYAFKADSQSLESPEVQDGGDDAHIRVRRDPREIVEEAVRNEWHRLRQQRMELAA